MSDRVFTPEVLVVIAMIIVGAAIVEGMLL